VAQHKTLGEYTEIYTKAFLENCATLRLERPERLVPAPSTSTTWSGRSNALGAGNTPIQRGSVYFRISTFPDTASSRTTISAATWRAARVDVDEYERPTPRFRAVESAKEGEPFWPPPSARPPRMAHRVLRDGIKYLARRWDIQRRRRRSDLPHHENEIAQSESLTGKPSRAFGLHAEFLMVEGQKMSKSLGNYYTLRDLLEPRLPAGAIRYLLASAPYRKSLNFTFDAAEIVRHRHRPPAYFKLRLETDQYPIGVNEPLLARTAQAFPGIYRQPQRRPQHGRSPGRCLRVRARCQQLHDRASRAGNAAAALQFLGRFDSIFDVLRPTVAAGELSDAGNRLRIAERTRPKKPEICARRPAYATSF